MGRIHRPHGPPSPVPYFAVRAVIVSTGVALLLADADGPLAFVAWGLVVVPLAGEVAGSVRYLRRCASGDGSRRRPRDG